MITPSLDVNHTCIEEALNERRNLYMHGLTPTYTQLAVLVTAHTIYVTLSYTISIHQIHVMNTVC
jgi:hypothetical protein